MHFEFTYFYFVLIHLELKRYLRSYMYTPVVSSKTILDSSATWAKCFQTKKAPKSYRTYLYVLYKGVPPRGPDPFHD